MQPHGPGIVKLLRSPRRSSAAFEPINTGGSRAVGAGAQPPGEAIAGRPPRAARATAECAAADMPMGRCAPERGANRGRAIACRSGTERERARHAAVPADSGHDAQRLFEIRRSRSPRCDLWSALGLSPTNWSAPSSPDRVHMEELTQDHRADWPHPMFPPGGHAQSFPMDSRSPRAVQHHERLPGGRRPAALAARDSRRRPARPSAPSAAPLAGARSDCAGTPG